MAIASLVLGIVALLITLLTGGIFGWVGAIIAIIGIVLGVLGKNEPENEGMAKAGMIISIVALVLSILIYVACIACATSIGNAAYFSSLFIA